MRGRPSAVMRITRLDKERRLRPEDIDENLHASRGADRARLIEKELETYPFSVEGMSVLDLGAGPGEFCVAVANAGARSIVWQDIEPEFERAARARISADAHARFELRDMMDLPYKEGVFDLVAIRGALYWADDEPRLIHQVARAIRPRGG